MDEIYLLVDGYNIIHDWDSLSYLASYDLGSARDKLISTMSNYMGYKGYRVIIVFDAYKVKNKMVTKVKHGNIDVVFTKEAETADQYIEKITSNLARNKKVYVATSDALEQCIILSKGAIRISARELEIEVINMEKEIDKRTSKSNKKNYLSNYMDEKTKIWMEKFRRQ